jgi:hypothetical protein
MADPKVPSRTAGGAVSSEADIGAFLQQVRAMAPARNAAGKRGRLIFAMDATMSRQPTWDRALQIQSEMFAETERVGGLDVQLVYFRGFRECRASRWVSEPQALAQLMTAVECRGGNTQIGRVLSHVIAESGREKVNAAVYVGDALEESIDRLCQKAGEIGMMGLPLFMFQEGSDPLVEQGFREIARLTGGAWFRLDATSARMLRELLSAVAVYAAGGRAALADLSEQRGGSARLLLEKLA